MKIITNKINIPYQKLKDLYINKELSTIKIGKIFNCNGQTISNRLKEYKIPIRTCYAKVERKIPKKELEKLYWNDHLSMKKIAKIYNTTADTIWEKLKKYNIRIRRKPNHPNISKKIRKRTKDRKWLRFIKELKNKRGHECEFCGKKGNPDCAHILHPEYYPDISDHLMFVDWNILLLCRSCHSNFDQSSFREVFS